MTTNEAHAAQPDQWSVHWRTPDAEWLLSCPECGNHDGLEIERRRNAYRVTCKYCGIAGPAEGGLDEAVDRWNRWEICADDRWFFGGEDEPATEESLAFALRESRALLRVIGEVC